MSIWRLTICFNYVGRRFRRVRYIIEQVHTCIEERFPLEHATDSLTLNAIEKTSCVHAVRGKSPLKFSIVRPVRRVVPIERPYSEIISVREQVMTSLGVNCKLFKVSYLNLAFQSYWQYPINIILWMTVALNRLLWKSLGDIGRSAVDVFRLIWWNCKT